MSNESLLKKEFKESDIQRVRNIVNKDFTKKTKVQSGYQKNKLRHKEGDTWEEGGKTWTIKNGIKQNITKLDSAKKALRVPLACPKCGGPMSHHLAKKMYKIHGFCFDPCTVEMEASLRKAGLYKEYERKMITGNIVSFLKDIENWVVSSVDDQLSFVTEAGDVEDWGGMSKNSKEKILKDLKGYSEHIRKQL
tara:strand:- start:64 stop:642 length:579 start_codon:yes stop_codon:yes gene_type:complete